MDMGRIFKLNFNGSDNRSRAMEIPRASFINQIRTSEGANQLQHRICGPAVAMSFNVLVAISIIMANKFVLGKVGFNYPICLSLIHFILSWFFMAIMNVFSLLPATPPANSTSYMTILALAIVISVSTALGNASLNYNSVGFSQMAKIGVTPTIVLTEYMIFQKTVSYPKILALTIISIGVAISTVTDLEFNLFGGCIALACIIPSIANKIMWSNLQQKGNWTAFALMWKTTPIVLLVLLALMPLLDPSGILLFNWTFRNTSAIFLSAVLGFLIQLSGALALGATSPVTSVVLGQFKTCTILLGGVLIFDSNPGMVSVCGSIIALCGVSWYTYLNLHGSPQQSSMESKHGKQNSDAQDESI